MPENPNDSRDEKVDGQETVDDMLTDYKHQSEAKTQRLRQADRKTDPKNRKRRLPLLLALLPAFFALTVWNIVRYSEEPATITPLEEIQAAEWTICLIVDGIETCRESTGRLPVSLEVIGLEDELVTYSVQGNSYTLRAMAGEKELTYHDGDDLEPFYKTYNTLMAGEVQ